MKFMCQSVYLYNMPHYTFRMDYRNRQENEEKAGLLGSAQVNRMLDFRMIVAYENEYPGDVPQKTITLVK